MTEATAVEERGRITPEDLGIWNDAQAEALSPVADFIASQGSVPAIQLAKQWIDEGRILPVDPLLFQMNMWAVTQHYAEYEAQARFLLETPEGEALDADRIIREATELVLRRCGLTWPEPKTGVS